MLNFIYEDDYKHEYQSIPIYHATPSSNAVTTANELAGPEPGLLSQFLLAVFAGTTVLGQAQAEEIMEVGIDARNEMCLMEEVVAMTSTEGDESLIRMCNLIIRGVMIGGGICHFPLPDARKVL